MQFERSAGPESVGVIAYLLRLVLNSRYSIPDPQDRSGSWNETVLLPSMAAGGIDMMAARISEACEAGEKFIEVFYDTVDKRRQVSGVGLHVFHCIL